MNTFRDLAFGTPLTHRRRGDCTFVKLDARDGSGATVWVSFPGDDQDAEMVSAALLSRPNWCDECDQANEDCTCPCCDHCDRPLESSRPRDNCTCPDTEEE